MLRWASLLALAGLAAATGIIIWSGWAQVVEALAQAGPGIIIVALFHFAILFVSGMGWWMLMPGRRVSLFFFVYLMWIRAAVNNLMPVARIGGEVVAVRILTAKGLRRNTAIAVTVVELTLSVLAIFAFVTLGVILFALHVGGGDTARKLGWALALTLPILAAFVLVQKIGLFGLLSRLFRVMVGDRWTGLAGDVARLDRMVHAFYRRRGRVLACGGTQFVAWAMGSIEIWLALRFLGHALPFGQSLMIEALVQGSSSIAFAIPGALGVQEAGFLLFGKWLGLPADIAAALAIMRRCRDLLCYVPALIVWQAQEGKRLFRI